MLDFAVYELKYDITQFFDYFLQSGIAERFERGDFSILVGKSGVPIRTIQQYEQRQKNINKAQVEYLLKLSTTLCCDVESLIEKVQKKE